MRLPKEISDWLSNQMYYCQNCGKQGGFLSMFGCLYSTGSISCRHCKSQIVEVDILVIVEEKQHGIR